MSSSDADTSELDAFQRACPHELPREIRDFNFDERLTFCGNPACLDYLDALENAYYAECPDTADFVAKYPDVLDPTFCPDAPTSPPDAPETDPTTEVGTVSESPTPTSILVPSVSPGGLNRSADVLPSAVVTSAPAATAKSGDSTTTIAAAGGGGLVAVILVIIIVLVVRRRRRNESDRSTAHDGFAYRADKNDRTPMGTASNAYEYHDASTARTTMDDTLTESDLLRGGLALATVRIPYQNLLLGEVISQGGFSEVVRGSYNGQTVAIQRLLAARRKDPHSIRGFFNEIELTATLEHECIVRFIGVSWDIPANLCMVSEFMHGGDLRSLLTNYSHMGHPNGHDDTKLRMASIPFERPSSTATSSRVTSCSRLMATPSSCERQDQTMTAGVGTSLWMAPEVMLGQRYDEKADVFSFGVILSELDTHELPYDHARDTVSGQKLSNLVMLQLIADGKLKPRFTAAADPDMVTLAIDCLQVDPTKRPLASQVLYRIHQSLQQKRSLTAQTRVAIESSLATLDTRTSMGRS